MVFQRFPHTNLLRRKFNYAAKRSKVNILSSFEHVELESTIYTKIQPQSFLGSGEEYFQEFLPYKDMAAILFNCMKHLNKLACTFDRRPHHVKSGENCSSVKRRNLKITQFYRCILPRGKGR